MIDMLILVLTWAVARTEIVCARVGGGVVGVGVREYGIHMLSHCLMGIVTPKSL